MTNFEVNHTNNEIWLSSSRLKINTLEKNQLDLETSSYEIFEVKP
jgi:hypothetical protein